MPTIAPTSATPDDRRHDAAEAAAERDRLSPGHLDLGPEGLVGTPAHRRFVAVFVVSLVALFAGTFTFTYVVDPLAIHKDGRYGQPGILVLERRAKVERIMELDEPPHTIVLGSSTARNFDPAAIRRLTGEPAFNASVASGAPVEMFALTSLVYERFPDAQPHLVYGVDIDTTFDRLPITPAIRTTPELWRQFDRVDQARLQVPLLRPYLSLDNLRLAVERVATRPDLSIRHELLRRARADGYRVKDLYDHAHARRRMVRHTQAYADRIYSSNRYRDLDALATRWFERLVAQANRHGDTPTLIVMPVHPWAQRRLTPYGWRTRRDLVLDHLHALARRHDVEIVDYQNATAFGGSPDDFNDNVHLTPEASTRLLTALYERRR